MQESLVLQKSNAKAHSAASVGGTKFLMLAVTSGQLNWIPAVPNCSRQQHSSNEKNEVFNLVLQPHHSQVHKHSNRLTTGMNTIASHLLVVMVIRAHVCFHLRSVLVLLVACLQTEGALSQKYKKRKDYTFRHLFN